MNTDFNYQLRRLDESIFNLLDERARLLSAMSERPRVGIDDILARHEGPMSAAAMKSIAEAINEAFESGDPS